MVVKVFRIGPQQYVAQNCQFGEGYNKQNKSGKKRHLIAWNEADYYWAGLSDVVPVPNALLFCHCYVALRIWSNPIQFNNTSKHIK